MARKSDDTPSKGQFQMIIVQRDRLGNTGTPLGNYARCAQWAYALAGGRAIRLNCGPSKLQRLVGPKLRGGRAWSSIIIKSKPEVELS
jgi:hypothetical protein